MRKIKERLYKGRLKKYLEAGKLYESYSESRLNEIAANLSPFAKRYFKGSLKQPNIRAYHDVQGQLTLIDADIFDLIPNDYQEYDLECAFNVGQFFFNIKLIDFFLDNRTTISLEKRINLLDQAEKVLLGEEISTTENLGFDTILEILSLNPKLELKNIGKNLKINVVKSLSQISNKKRLQTSLEIGADMGQIMYEIMNEAYKMPEWSKNFLIQQGKTANLFDDTKDFLIDRKLNQGYSFTYFPVLFSNFCKEYYKTNTSLPNFESFKRFYQFMFLGSVFQLEELFHLKSRS